ASGGELARSMLALQVVLSRYERAPTMVFDEVDAGIGGRAGAVVGEKLAAVGAGRQVLCVTHLAPIAALAHQHVRVAKSVRGGRTRASAGVVAGDERVAEIARMLGGDASGAAARQRAARSACATSTYSSSAVWSCTTARSPRWPPVRARRWWPRCPRTSTPSRPRACTSSPSTTTSPSVTRSGWDRSITRWV